MTTNGHVANGEMDRIMNAWHDIITATKAKLHGPLTKDSRTNQERDLEILVTYIIPHTFRFKSGSSPNDLNDLEEDATRFMVWNYPEFARIIRARANGLKITSDELFSRAFDVLVRHDPSARVRVLEILFGEQFVLKAIGDREAIFSASRRHRPDSSDDPEELKTTPSFTSTRA